ncbi:hypothetical protein, partial [Aquimarina pacifica]|uniref:hypothetical protein n=1 Tax=Aquimarina pacifica TaxID=1296415 RepID=UPI0012693A59
MKRSIKLFVFFFSIVIYSQDDNSTENILPASPDVAGLYKYVATPVSYYTGIPRIDVPLYDIKGIDGGLNINLSYHSGGIKVSEESGIVGLGWSLNAGGMITRSISGRDDFGPEGYLITGSEVITSGLKIPDLRFSTNGEIGQPFLKRTDCTFEVNGEGQFYPDMHPNDIDAVEFGDWSPDTFYFNFNGYSGKFWMDQYGENIKTDQNNGLIINMIGNGAGFEIITPDGTKYEFNELEYTSGQLRGEYSPRSYVSSWFLSKITDSKNEIVEFIYDLEKTFIPMASYTQYQDPVTGGPAITFQGLNVYGGTFRITSKYLTEIVTNKETIKFNYSDEDERLDIANTYFLKNIEIYPGSSTSLEKMKHVDFEYSYFGEEKITTTNNLSISNGDYRSGFSSNSDPYLRLKLDKVIINEEEEYNFEYNHFENNPNVSTPSKTTFSQDYWGFYNGKVNAGSFIPVIVDPETNNPFTMFAGPLPVGIKDVKLADRKPYEYYTKFGLLNKVIHPTKGFTTFEHEPNSFYGDLNKTTGYTIPTAENTKEVSNYSHSGYTEVKFTPEKDAFAKVFYSVTCFRKGDYGFEYPQGADINASINNGAVEGTEFYNFYRELQDIGGHTAIGGTVYGFSETVYTTLKAGVEYTLMCNANETNAFSSNATIRVEYYESQKDNEELLSINKGGGLRIKSISNYDNTAQPLNKRVFDYHYIEDGEEKSYGKAIKFPSFTEYRYMSHSRETAVYYDYLHPFAKASSQPAISPFQGSYVGYSQVSESYVDSNDFAQNGKMIYKYHNDIDNEKGPFYPQPFDQSYQQFAPNRNPINGLLYEKQYLKLHEDDYTLLKKEEFNYKINNINAFDFELYDVYKHTDYILGGYLVNHLNISPFVIDYCIDPDCSLPGFPYDPCKDDYFMFYPYYSHLTQKMSEIITVYDTEGLNPVTTTSSYTYGNVSIPTTPTGVVTTNSKGEVIENVTYYPDDIDGVNSLPSGTLTQAEYVAIQRLQKGAIEHRIGQPVQSETYMGDILTSVNRTNFRTENGITLPASIASATGSEDVEEKII